MSLLHADSFDSFTSIGTMGATYDSTTGSTGGILTTGKNNNGAQLSNGASSGGIKWTKNVSSPGTVIVGLAVKINTANSADYTLFTIGSITVIIQTSTNAILVKNGGTTLVTSAYNLIVGTWTYIEVKILFSASVGTVEVRFNTTNVGSTSGANTGSAPTSVILCNGSLTSGILTIDDYYICDTSGAVNNDFLGPVKLFSLVPNGAGNYTAWTQTGGTGGSPWTAVNEAEPNGDTSYVADSVVNDRSSFALGNLSDTSNTIKGVRILTTTKKDDVVGRVICPFFRISSTDYDQSNYTETTSYVSNQQIVEQSPASSSAWTATEINGMEIGVKVVS